jgi:hypothetical protein
MFCWPELQGKRQGFYDYAVLLLAAIVRPRKRGKGDVEMIVCVSLNPDDTPPLLDYSVNFTAR